MKRFKKIFFSLLMICLLLTSSMSVFAAYQDSAGALRTLCDEAKNVKDNVHNLWDYSGSKYKCSDGSYLIYNELVSTGKSEDLINDVKLKKLTTGAKNDFLKDYYNAAQKYTTYCEEEGDGSVTTETMTNWMELLQNESGVGSQLMTTLMSQTQPDFVTANRIYAPFSGTVGTILGIVSILIMAFLAITMVLDLAYIAIPTFQLFVDGDGQNGGQGGGKKKSFISHEAIEAVQQAEGGQGGGGQNGGSNKLAVSIYFKKRVLMLVVLGICLLYLISGNIFSLVGWLIDLLSGFLGF